MQDRYAGDVGDFVKLGILRALAPYQKLGIAWWLYPDEVHNGNGRHVGYLDQPDRWRSLDPELFDGLKNMVKSGCRSVRYLEEAELLPGAVFNSEIIPINGTPADRRSGRLAWFGRVQAAMRGCDIVFVDPDNGLETAGFSSGAVVGGKSVSLSELSALSCPGRTVVVYHHQTRRKGGHLAELEYWADKLRSKGFQTVDAIRSRPYSPRAFFLLNASALVRERAERLTERWSGLLTWHLDIHASRLAS